jgi:fucose permease
MFPERTASPVTAVERAALPAEQLQAIQSAGLVMAILGGAIMPLVQGAVIDAWGATLSFVVPAACFLVVVRYGFFDLRAERPATTAAAQSATA